MKEFPKGGLIGRAVHLVQTISDLHIPLYAANAGYFIILSIFPALVLLLGILRYTGLQVESLIEILGSVIPDALMGTIGDVVVSTYENSSAGLVGVSAVTALWSASRGVYSLLTGLNAIYGVSEDRGFFYTRGISVLYTFLFFLVLLLTLVLHVFGGDLLHLLEQLPIPAWLLNLLDLRVFLLLIMQTALFCTMFMVLPNERNRLQDSLPGSLLASIGWQVFTNLYSVYSQKFTAYANIYGSVYVVALGMLWMYFCICIVFYGGVLNKIMEKWK